MHKQSKLALLNRLTNLRTARPNCYTEVNGQLFYRTPLGNDKRIYASIDVQIFTELARLESRAGIKHEEFVTEG